MSLSVGIIIEKTKNIDAFSDKLTQLLQHFVALVKDEMFQVLQVELLVANEGEDSAGCANDNVRCHGLESFLVLLDWHSSEEDANLDSRHVLAETLVFLADLEGQLTSVTHDEDENVVIGRLELLKRCQDENSGLSHTRFRLAQNIHAQDGLWNAFVLY
jgi:hypothetical protein